MAPHRERAREPRPAPGREAALNVVNSLAELEQKLALEKFSGVVRLSPKDETEAKRAWAETQRIQALFPALPILLVRGVLGDEAAEEETGRLLRDKRPRETFLMLPHFWIAWHGSIPAVYGQSGMIVRDLLSMFGGRDPVEAVSAWIEETMGIERGTGKLKPRNARKNSPGKAHAPGAADPAPRKTRAVPPTPHAVLGLPENAGAAAIRSAYRKLCTKYHPDKWAQASKREQDQATRRMTEINAAYEVLKKRG